MSTPPSAATVAQRQRQLEKLHSKVHWRLFSLEQDVQKKMKKPNHVLGWSPDRAEWNWRTYYAEPKADAPISVRAWNGLFQQCSRRLVLWAEQHYPREMRDARRPPTPELLFIPEQLDMRICHACYKMDGPQLVCGQCKSAIYCGVQCQSEDWERGHRDVCFQ